MKMARLMKRFCDQSGQMALLMAVGALVFIAITGMSIDVGYAYIIRGQLQNATNAAALAAAGAVYNTSSTEDAVAVAKTYSAGNSFYKNYNSALGTVTTTLTTLCVNSISACSTSNPVANVIRIKETTQVKTFFMAIFGVKTLTVAATATASMLGRAQPWNVAIILDATGSMNNRDSYCTASSSYTAEECALAGVQTMLKAINPCSSGASSCSPDSSDALFRVSLFSFPNVTTDTVSQYYNCSGGNASVHVAAHTLPIIPSSSSTIGYTPLTYSRTTTSSKGGGNPFGGGGGNTTTTSFTATYQVTPASVGNADANGFLSDYFLSTASTGLNSSSILIKAVGNGSTTGCLQPQTRVSAGYYGLASNLSSYETYFASAIYAAQAALQAEQAKVAKLGITSNNAIIVVSDGQANSDYPWFPQVTSTTGSSGYSVTSSGSSKTTGTNLTTSGVYGYYPDYHNDCQQAIQAAQYAKSLGTRMYAVAYGSEANGCVSDTSLNSIYTGTLNVAISSVSSVIPCRVMMNIASQGATEDSPWYFYTDGSSTANGCSDTSHTSTDLTSIFGAIASTFTNPRLLPSSLTGTTVKISTF